MQSLRYVNENEMTMIKWWLQKKKLEKKKKPSRSSFIFHCNNTIYMHTTTTKSLILNLFPFEFFLNSLKKTSIIFPVRNFWKSLLLQYILSIYLHEKEKNNNPQLLYFSCLLLLYCRSIIHYYTILSFCNKNYSMFYRIRKKKIENYRFHQNRKEQKMLLYYYYYYIYYYILLLNYIENVPLCKKQRSLCVLSWCLNTTITRDSILFMMGTLNKTYKK